MERYTTPAQHVAQRTAQHVAYVKRKVCCSWLYGKNYCEFKTK